MHLRVGDAPKSEAVSPASRRSRGLYGWRLRALGLAAASYGFSAVAGCNAEGRASETTTTDGGRPDSGGDGAGSSIPDVVTDSGVGPRHAPNSLTFGRDQDPRRGVIAGVVVIGKASDESDVNAYKLYWASGPSTKVGAAVASFTKTGSDITYELDASVPDGAAHLIAVSANDEGEMNPGVTTPAVDNFPMFVDISAVEDGGVGGDPSAVVDDVNGKLLVAVQRGSHRLGLVLCNLDGTDGTGCKLRDVWATGGGTTPSAVIDKARGKLLVATENLENDSALGFFSSNLDGSGARAHNAYTPGSEIRGVSAVMDSANGKMLVATLNTDNWWRSSLYRCDVSTGNCSATDISPDAGKLDVDAWDPSAVIDEVNAKVLVVSRDSHAGPRLARCNLDGANCTFQLIRPKSLFGPGLTAPFETLVDSESRKLLVVGPNTGSPSNPDAGVRRPALVRCDLDTDAGCTDIVDISAGQPDFSGGSPSAVIDTTNGKLLVVAIRTDHFSTMGLFRCNLDGTACTHTDMSAGLENISNPSAVIDKANGRLLVAAAYGGGRLGLFSIGLW